MTNTYTGVDKLPIKLYHIVGPKGEEITDDPVKHSQVVDILIGDRAVRRELNSLIIEHAIPVDDWDLYREFNAKDTAEDLGYRIIEVLR